jgi:hypothetical protein
MKSSRLSWAALALSYSLALVTPSVTAAELTNAALAKYGGNLTATAGAGAKVDTKTSPGDLADGNVHSRLVVSGAPYTLSIELLEKIQVDKLAFAHSDYLKELAPQQIEVSVDGGAPVAHTLELKRPEAKRKPVWQEIPIGQQARKIEIKVLANFPGEDEKINWGGFGEIAVLTPEDLDAKFELAGHNPDAPTFVHAEGSAEVKPVKVTLPPVVAAGEYPRLLFTKGELAELKQTVESSEKGKKSLDVLMNLAKGAAGKEPKFPTPEDTAANNAGKEHDKLSYSAHALGFAYGLTGDEAFAKGARDILVGYAERYESYPRHSAPRNRNDASKVTFQRLSEAMWLIPLLESYDYIRLSSALSAADRELIEAKLFRAAIEEIRRKTPAAEVADRDRKSAAWRTESPEPAVEGKYPNWLCFYNTATMMAGSLMDDQDMMDLAAADFRTAIATGIGADGMWGEGAIGYQLFAMSVLSPGFEAAARRGIDLWGFQGGRFKQLFDSPLRYAYPDGTLPGINDSGRGKMGSWQSMVYDYGFRRYGDPGYAFLVNSSPRQLHVTEGIYQPTLYFSDLPEPPGVEAASTLFGSLGYAIQRDATKYVLLDYGPHGGTHGHPDKLNILLFAAPPGKKGDEMGGEPAFYKYEDARHPNWTKRTVAHNTMTVGENNQLASDGKLLVYEATPTLSVMRGEATKAYPGVLLDRTVVVLPDLVLDLYLGRSSTPRTYDRTYLYQGALEGAQPGGEPLGKGAGYQEIKVSARQPAAETWRGSWETKVGGFNVTVAGAPGQEAITAKGLDDVDMVLMRQQGKEGAFATAYQLGDWGAPVSLAWKPAGEGVRVAEAKYPDGRAVQVFVADGPAWKAEGWESDARVLVVAGSGDKRQVLLGGGSFAKSTSGELKLDQPGNALAGGSPLKVASSWSPSK